MKTGKKEPQKRQNIEKSVFKVRPNLGDQVPQMIGKERLRVMKNRLNLRHDLRQFLLPRGPANARLHGLARWDLRHERRGDVSVTAVPNRSQLDDLASAPVFLIAVQFHVPDR